MKRFFSVPLSFTSKANLQLQTLEKPLPQAILKQGWFLSEFKLQQDL